VARTVARAFKDFILVAAAAFVVKPRIALMASQRNDASATSRDCPYCISDLESALMRVESARAEAGPLERERPRCVSFQQAVYTGAMRSSV
jgi:hypothetical protein